MEKLKIDDLMNYRFLSEITASPSGKKAAFLVKQADRKKNGYASWVYIVDFSTEEVRKLTSFGAEKNLVFDDEETVLFSSERKPEDKAKELEEGVSGLPYSGRASVLGERSLFRFKTAQHLVSLRRGSGRLQKGHGAAFCTRGFPGVPGQALLYRSVL